MKIARIEMYQVAVPLPATLYPSWIPGYPQTENRYDLIRIITDDGVEGFAAGPRMSNERAGLGSVLGPFLLGEDPTDIDLMQQRLRELAGLGLHNWWIEPAFWDIRGKVAGKPVCELLGGTPRRVRLYASTLELKDPKARIEEAEARYAEGFRTIKLRIHDLDERKDIAQVVETANAVGAKMKIAVDANQAWHVGAIAPVPNWDLERAKRFADVCADAGVAWLEEPLPIDDYAALTALTAYSKVPISGGELHTGGLPELRMMIEHKCYDIFQPDAVFTGGIAQTFEVAKLCAQHGLIYKPHTHGTEFGFAVNLHLMAASDFADEELEYTYATPAWTIEAPNSVLTEPFRHRNGELEVPSTPGLGVDIDRRALRRWGKRTFVMDKKRLFFFALRERGVRVSREIDHNRRARISRA